MSPETITVIKGINTKQLTAFNEQYAAAAPGTFTLGLQAKTIWEGQGLGNLGKVGRWTLGGQPIEKPTRDFSVQLGSWKERNKPLARLRRIPRVPCAPFTLFFQNGGPTVRALLAGRLLDPGGNRPNMPGRVHNPSGPVAPELVLGLDKELGPSADGALDRGVDVLDIDEDHDGRAAIRHRSAAG